MSEATNTARIEQLKQNPQLEYVHDTAIMLAASAWQDKSTEHLVMIPELAIVFAQILNFWIRESKQLDDNLHFYLDLLDQCAKHIGPAAYTDDTGQLHDSPMRLKIPKLVQELTNK